MKTIKNHIQRYLYQWFSNQQTGPSTKNVKEFPFISILDNQEWKDSIFFGNITYQDLLVQAYLCRVQTEINNSQHSGYRQVYSQWIPDISIYLLSTLLFGGTLIIRESPERQNSFCDDYQIDCSTSSRSSFKEIFQESGTIYFKGKPYSVSYLLRAVGQFVATLQRDPQNSIFDQLQQVSFNTEHSLENLVLLVYSLLLGKKIVFYSLDSTLTNHIIPISEYLVSERNIWKPQFRPTHQTYLFHQDSGKITMHAKPIEDSVSIRNLEQFPIEMKLSLDLVYTSDSRSRDETLKTVHSFDHFKKSERQWIRRLIENKKWHKIMWIPSRKQLQIIQSISDSSVAQHIITPSPIPDIPIYQRLLLLLAMPILLAIAFVPLESTVGKKQHLFWSCSHNTNWKDWLPQWIQTTFPYICWIWVPESSTPMFAIGGKIIWGKWPGWSQLWFSYMFLTKLLGIKTHRTIHIRILTPEEDTSHQKKESSITYTSAQKTPYISITQYSSRTYVQASLPSSMMPSLKDGLCRLKKNE